MPYPCNSHGQRAAPGEEVVFVFADEPLVIPNSHGYSNTMIGGHSPHTPSVFVGPAIPPPAGQPQTHIRTVVTVWWNEYQQHIFSAQAPDSCQNLRVRGEKVRQSGNVIGVTIEEFERPARRRRRRGPRAPRPQPLTVSRQFEFPPLPAIEPAHESFAAMLQGTTIHDREVVDDKKYRFYYQVIAPWYAARMAAEYKSLENDAWWKLHDRASTLGWSTVLLAFEEGMFASEWTANNAEYGRRIEAFKAAGGKVSEQ